MQMGCHKFVSLYLSAYRAALNPQLRENWMMINLPDLILKIGGDLFVRLAEQAIEKTTG